MHSRREFNTLALAGVAACCLPGLAGSAAAMVVRGVKIGLITGSLNPLPENTGRDPVDVIVEQCKALGVVDVELVSVFPQGAPQVVNGGRFGQPPAEAYARLPADAPGVSRVAHRAAARPVPRGARQVRQGRPQPVLVRPDNRRRHDGCGNRRGVSSDAGARGADIHNQPDTGRDGAADGAVLGEVQIRAAWHPHALVQDPNEVATPASMEKLLAMSTSFVINLDIGHYTAGNNDGAAFLRKHHDRITHLHVKDRKRDQGPNVQLGAGDTPIRECATLIRDNRWPIMLILEREYRDAPGTAVEQTRWQLDYVRSLLES